MVEPIPFDATTNPVITTAQYNKLLAQLETTASYIVRKNGAYYEALKGGTSTNALNVIYGGSGNLGATDGTDAAAVIQACLDDDPKIFLKDATYPIENALIPPSDTVMTGESWDTILKLPDGQTVAAATGNVIYNSGDVSNITIENLQIDGNKDNNAGLTAAHTGSNIYSVLV